MASKTVLLRLVEIVEMKLISSLTEIGIKNRFRNLANHKTDN
jgi:hypothetical protein